MRGCFRLEATKARGSPYEVGDWDRRGSVASVEPGTGM